MSSRELAIEKVEAWARWELSSGPDRGLGLGLVKTPGYVPADQADHMTVELALKDFQSGRGADPRGLRALMLHIYGHDAFVDSFDPLAVFPETDSRSKAKVFLQAYGWRIEAFVTGSLRRFLKFLGERLRD